MKKRGKNYSREISINNFFTLSSKRRLYPKGHINTPLHPLYFGTHIRRRTLSLITLSYLESAYLCSKTAPSNTVDLTPRNTKSNALRPGKSFEGRANCSKLSTLSAIVFIGGQLLLDGSNPRNLDVSRMTSPSPTTPSTAIIHASTVAPHDFRPLLFFYVLVSSHTFFLFFLNNISFIFCIPFFNEAKEN